MSKTGRTSQRKLNEPSPSLSHLEDTLTLSTELLASLREEVQVWAHVNPETPELIARDSEEMVETEDLVIESDFGLAAIVDEIASQRQRQIMKLRKLEVMCDEVFEQFQAQLKIDFAAQNRVCDVLR
jgi:hypothetical protein